MQNCTGRQGGEVLTFKGEQKKGVFEKPLKARYWEKVTHCERGTGNFVITEETENFLLKEVKAVKSSIVKKKEYSKYFY